MKSNGIPEIECIEAIEAIESEYKVRHGISPFNVSHWDPTADFQSGLLHNLHIPSLHDVIPYHFSYQITDTPQILRKLGGTPNQSAILNASNTTSILCVLNWLKGQGGQEVIAACPAYFSLFHAGPRLGIKIIPKFMKRVGMKYILPQLRPKRSRVPSVLWITNPVYGASVYLDSGEVERIKDLLESGWIVISDECLALPGRELTRIFGRYPNFIGIYSPHKAACVNGMKFSLVAYDGIHKEFMEKWVDVWSGGLGCSSMMAIAHYLSPNFDSYLDHFLKAIGDQKSMLVRLSQNVNSVEVDADSIGHFVACYVPGNPAILGDSMRFLSALIEATGGSIIPGNRSRLNPEIGFSFRVNLARAHSRFMPTLARVINFVSSYRQDD